MSTTKNFFRASAEDFKKIPGSPIAYWASSSVFNVFSHSPKLGSLIDARIGLVSGDNNRFLRFWYEVDRDNIEYNAKPGRDPQKLKWYPLQKGGKSRLWYGNLDYVINWEDNGWAIIHDNSDNGRIKSHNYNGVQQFKEGITWNSISSSTFSCRYSPEGFTFDAAGPLCEVIEKDNLHSVLGFLSSVVAKYFLTLTNPTINFPSGYLELLPYAKVSSQNLGTIVEACLGHSRADWDAYETSWDFKVNPLVALSKQDGMNEPLSVIYPKLRDKWAADCAEMQRLETENNRIFIEAYGLEEELTPEVPWHEITLTCNPWYRYGVKFEGDSGQELGACGEMPMDEALEERLRADTVKELISYAVG